MKKPKDIQEWKSYQNYKGGVNNLAVCRLNFSGEGSAARAIGTSTVDMKSAVRNAYRNYNRAIGAL